MLKKAFSILIPATAFSFVAAFADSDENCPNPPCSEPVEQVAPTIDDEPQTVLNDETTK